SQPVIEAQAPAFGNVTLPDFGPIVPERPQINLPAQSPFSVASLSYADERVQRASHVFAALDGAGMSPAEILRSWKRQAPPAGSPTEDYIAAGSFEDAAEAQRVAARLSSFGKTEIQRSEFEGEDWYSVNLYP
ncbi:MAG: septal ring lytic transglycosylase RlpA family protein, partial [Mesorhizobium sp.]